jgi:hypothetical protein
MVRETFGLYATFDPAVLGSDGSLLEAYEEWVQREYAASEYSWEGGQVSVVGTSPTAPLVVEPQPAPEPAQEPLPEPQPTPTTGDLLMDALMVDQAQAQMPEETDSAAMLEDMAFALD